MTQQHAKRHNVVFDDQQPSLGNGREELLNGLRQQQKSINPKFFYNAKGSELFEQITRLPEYYPTRTEVSILQRYCNDISEYCGKECILIEPGSGTSEKVRLLLDALRPQMYMPLDISAEFLYESALQLGREFPWLHVHAICADFAESVALTDKLPPGKRVIFYPGSTIGNMEPEHAIDFLVRLRNWMGSGGGALIGVDLHKPEQRLNAAYNDTKGITAAFNLNVLDHINPILDAEFDKTNFFHQAFYNTDQKRIEMHLVSKCRQTVRCNGSDLNFTEGESIHTENSYKYTLQGFTELATAAGLQIAKRWLDDEQLFSVHYLTN